MTDPNTKNQRILHGNSAKIENKNNAFFTSQSYRTHTEPKQYDFDTLPGNEDDINNAREKNVEK